MKIFVSKAMSSVKIMNFSIGEIDMSILVDVFQITVDFVFVYNNKGVYEHDKAANLQQIDLTGGFQLSLHAANAKSQRTVFTINMPPSFLLWRIALNIVFCNHLISYV